MGVRSKSPYSAATRKPEPAAGPQMLADALEASDLVAHLQQVLKGAERNNDELELFPQVKFGHVALDEVKAFPFFFVERSTLSRGVLEHALGKVETGDAL